MKNKKMKLQSSLDHLLTHPGCMIALSMNDDDLAGKVCETQKSQKSVSFRATARNLSSYPDERDKLPYSKISLKK